jgi:hypothetical protein
VAPSGPFTVYFWPSGLVNVNDVTWWTSTDQPGAGSTVGSFRHPSQGPLGSLAGSFCSDIACHPRILVPDGLANSGGQRWCANGDCQALDEFTIGFTRGEADNLRAWLSWICGAHPGTTIRFHGRSINDLVNKFK